MFSIFTRHKASGPVVVSSLDDAPEVCAALRAGLLVSISDPERREITTGRLAGLRARVCPLDFHDIDRPAPGLAAFEASHIDTALAALRKAPLVRPVVVHCHAGISRSSAIALLLATSRLHEQGRSQGDTVDLAIEQILRSAPHARPNMRVIEAGATQIGIDPAILIDRCWQMHRGATQSE